MTEFITLADAIPDEPVALTQSDVDEGNLYVEGVLRGIRRDPASLSDGERASVKDLALAYAYYRAYLREAVNDTGAYAVKVKRYKELYEQKTLWVQRNLLDWNIQIQRG